MAEMSVMPRTSWHLASEAASAGLARAAARTFLSGTEGQGWDEPAVLLLVSELVSNAVEHAVAGRLGLDLTMELVADRLRITVDDHNPLPPVLLETGPESERGRGLLIVERLAAKWGWEPVAGNGKCVWCELCR